MIRTTVAFLRTSRNNDLRLELITKKVSKVLGIPTLVRSIEEYYVCVGKVLFSHKKNGFSMLELLDLSRTLSQKRQPFPYQDYNIRTK